MGRFRAGEKMIFYNLIYKFFYNYFCKVFYTTAFISLIFVFCGNSTVALASEPLKKLENNKLSVWTPPPLVRGVFPSSTPYFFYEKHDLPVLEISILVKLGSYQEPSDHLGINSFMLSLLETGGVGEWSAPEFDQLCEKNGIDISTKSEGEYSLIQIKGLSTDKDLIFKITNALLSSPHFESNRIETARTQFLATLVERNERPMSIANREWLQQLYGQDAPQARVPTEKTVKAITRAHLVKWFESYYRPDRFIFGLSGDITETDLNQFLKKSVFNKVQKLSAAAPVLEPVAVHPVDQQTWIDKTSNQSSVVMGHFGGKRFDQDKFSKIIANQILGGSTFGSRLGNKIRTELGLAYNIQSIYSLDTETGPFRILFSTKSKSTFQALHEVRHILRDMVDHGISKQELLSSKSTLLNQLVFQYEDPDDYITSQLIYNFYGYPADYLTIYQKKIAEVSKKEVNQTLKKSFDPNHLQVLVVGDPTERTKIEEGASFKVVPLDNE